MKKNDLRNFIHPSDHDPTNKMEFTDDEQYETTLKFVRSNQFLGIKELRICHYPFCRKKQYHMKCCRACKSAFYCSRKCQKRHWVAAGGNHRIFCFNSAWF
eukprot:UN04184